MIWHNSFLTLSMRYNPPLYHAIFSVSANQPTFPNQLVGRITLNVLKNLFAGVYNQVRYKLVFILKSCNIPEAKYKEMKW